MALNWPGLLNWSTKYHDGTAPSNFSVMSDEDRKFLEAAMEEAFGKIENPNVIFQEAIQKTVADDRTPESVTVALEIIDRCADDPDVARNAEKLGGLAALLDVVQHFDGAIRVRALEVLALLFSNNPSIQTAAIKHGYLKALLQMAKDTPKASEERSKAFRALVALVRGVQEFEETLLRGTSGMGLIIEMMSFEEGGKSREKAINFVRSLAGDGRLVADDAKPLVSALAPLLASAGSESISYRETLSSGCTALAQAFPEQCAPELRAQVEGRLAQIMAAKAGPQDPDCEHEKANLEECMTCLAGS